VPLPEGPRIYLCTLKHDSGFVPNPFHGYCTLACCKPQIRRKARERGGWLASRRAARQPPCLCGASGPRVDVRAQVLEPA